MHGESSHQSTSSESGVTRREVIKQGLLVSATLATTRSLLRADPAPSAEGSAVAQKVSLAFELNGQAVKTTVAARTTLLDLLREDLAHPGTKKGCDHGQCGACTVHLDGKRVLSCLTLAATVQNKRVTTIEGLAHGENLHPLQTAFIEHDAFQCGFCTPGQLMSAAAFLKEPWAPTDDAIREGMSGNLCRCGAYCGIVAAIAQARAQGGASTST